MCRRDVVWCGPSARTGARALERARPVERAARPTEQEGRDRQAEDRLAEQTDEADPQVILARTLHTSTHSLNHSFTHSLIHSFTPPP